jgi:hypothetical protein
MTKRHGTSTGVAVALAALLGACSTWNSMDRQEKGTAVGAGGGAVVGAAVGGPIGAAVGAGVGGYAGHYETQPGGLASGTTSGTRYGSDTVRSVQQALNDMGYNAGPTDGQMGPNTRDALLRFQQSRGLPQTGEPDSQTLAALGIPTRYSQR